jgi:hypothetical protein
MNWRHLEVPLLPWVKTLDRIIAATRPPKITGSTLVIASDSSGSNARSRYRTSVHLCVDLDMSREWELRRRLVREKYLPDGRRMSYKALADVRRQCALMPFLEAAEWISGLCVATIFDKRLQYLCLNGPADYRRMHEAASLQARWKDRELEEALRFTHVIAALVGGLSQPNQQVCWVSDEDNMFGNERQSRDVARLLSSLSSHYARHPLGELGIATTALDEGDRWEEDLTVIPDLIAGALSETATRLSEVCGGHIPPVVAVPFDGPLLTKAEIVSRWFWSHGPSLRRVAILFARQPDGRYAVSRHEMVAG